jgi:hypothetical protein
MRPRARNQRGVADIGGKDAAIAAPFAGRGRQGGGVEVGLLLVPASAGPDASGRLAQPAEGKWLSWRFSLWSLQGLVGVLEHVVHGRDHLGIDLIGALAFDHVDQFGNDVDVRAFQIALLSVPRPCVPGMPICAVPLAVVS